MDTFVSKSRLAALLSAPPVVMTAVAALLALRVADALLWPVMLNEDGATMFAYYLNHPDWRETFRFYLGYISFLPNLIGYAVMRSTVAYAPYLLAWIPFAIATLALSMFSWPRFRFLVESDAARAAVCVVLAAMPVGSFAELTNTAFSQWHLLWMCMLLVIAPAPPNRLGAASVELVVLAALVWSHPLSVAVAPLALALLVLRPGGADRLRNACVIAFATAYLALGMEPSTSVFPPGLGRLPASADYVVQRVVFEALFGNDLRLALHGAGLAPVTRAVGGTVMVALCAWIYRRRSALTRDQWIAIIAAGAWIVGLTFLICVTRYIGVSEHARIWGQRYFYVQQLFVLALVTLACVSAWPRVRRGARVAVLCAFVAHVVVSGAANARFFHTSRSEGERLVVFAKEVDGWLSDPARPASHLTLVRRGGGKWDIRIEPPAPR